MKSATVIRHLPFEGLGSFVDVLEAQHYALHYCEAGLNDLTMIDALGADLLIVLGGPIGVNQYADYPWLGTEFDIVRNRLKANRPTLGICLGAQIMAHALGANVTTAPKAEIGWSTLDLSAAVRDSPLRHLEGTPVLHWHGDQLELPDGAERLASTPLCANQAFSLSANLLGLQCHPEVRWPELETWLIGHVRGLKANGISVTALREASMQHAPALEQAARRMLEDWLAQLKT